MTSVPLFPMSSVLPSGGDFAAISLARMPLTLGRLSTITLRPSASLSLLVTSLAAKSDGPPAGDGTSSLIGRFGASCAWDGTHVTTYPTIEIATARLNEAAAIEPE